MPTPAQTSADPGGHRDVSTSLSRSSAFPLAPRVHGALSLLLGAYHNNEAAGSESWDQALSMSALEQAGVNSSDLRWLIGRGLVEHAVDAPGSQATSHVVRRPNRARFQSGAVFRLTAVGAKFVQQLDLSTAESVRPASASRAAGSHRSVASPPLRPRWDRDRCELRVGSALARRFLLEAADQVRILAAFEEARWPESIESPLGLPSDGAAKRLRRAVDGLNNSCTGRLVRFFLDEKKQCVGWAFADAVDARSPSES